MESGRKSETEVTPSKSAAADSVYVDGPKGSIVATLVTAFKSTGNDDAMIANLLRLIMRKANEGLLASCKKYTPSIVSRIFFHLSPSTE